MAMVIRLLLIVSLVTQLVWSMECCSIVVLRPDIVNAQPMPCAPLGTCDTADNCCDDDAPSCCESMAACDADAISCESACDNSNEAPCKAMMCSPLEQKKPSPAAIAIDIVALVAHPVSPAALHLLVARPQNEPVAQIFFKRNHTRQAWLEVWRN
jgi:hypothetical protein